MTRRAGVVAVAALALATSACGSRVRDWPDDAASPAPTDAIAVGDVVDDTTSTTAAGVAAHGSATTRPTGAGSATTSAVGGIPAPASGRYVYDETTDLPAFEDEPASTTRRAATVNLRVTRAPSQVTWEAVESDDDPDEPSTETDSYVTTASTFSLVSTASRDVDGTDTCAYKPPLVLLQLPLRAGATWHSTAACSGDGYTESVSTNATVVGPATDTVGGQQVATFVVKWVLTYTDTYEPDPDDPEDPGSDTYSEERTSHIDPSTLLTVIDEIKDADPDFAVTVRRQLRSLTPSAA